MTTREGDKERNEEAVPLPGQRNYQKGKSDEDKGGEKENKAKLCESETEREMRKLPLNVCSCRT